jgi:hypothetical protein
MASASLICNPVQVSGSSPDGNSADRNKEKATSEEYSSLRAESLQAKSNQQSILQWSIGAVGVVAAAVLAALAALGDAKAVADNRLRLTAILITLGIVVPTLLVSAFAVWIGEVERMERVGRFIRSREETLWKWPPPSITSERAFNELPIFWENLIAAPRLGSIYGKNRTGSLAVCFLYLVSFITSVTIAIVVLWTTGSSTLPRSLMGWRNAIIYSMISLSGLVFLLLGHKLWQIRRRASNRRDARRKIGGILPLPDVTVVLPCLNEIDALPWVLDRMPNGFEPFVVDNNSTDGSGAFARQRGVCCIEQPLPGTGPTVVAALADPRLGHVVCIMDCDGTVDPVDLPMLVTPIALDAAEVVIGARRGYDARGWIQRAFSRLQALYVSRQLGLSIEDLGSAMAVTKELLDNINAATIDNGNAWKIELLRRARDANARITEVRIDHSMRIGESKITGNWAGKRTTIADALRVTGRPIFLRNRRISIDLFPPHVRFVPREVRIRN